MEQKAIAPQTSVPGDDDAGAEFVNALRDQ
jgi:hypothetical protein